MGLMRLPNLSGEFRVGSDPELRFTPSGKAVAQVSLIATDRVRNRQTDEWEDGDSTPWIRVSVWDQAAEDLVEKVFKGYRVLVTGQLYARTYTDRDGVEKQSIELKNATVAPIPGGAPRTERVRPQAGSYDDPWTTPASTPGGRPQQHTQPRDPWATPGQADEPPF